MDLISATIVLLLVMDPFGNMPILFSAMRGVPRERHTRIILRECAIAFAVLAAFLFGGQLFLSLLQLSQSALEMAGGVILFLIALRMVFAHPSGVFGTTVSAHAPVQNGSPNAPREPAPSPGEEPDNEPFIVPLAIPAIAGPSAMAIAMLFMAREPERWPVWLSALVIATVITAVVLLAAQRIADLVGSRGITAMEKLMGLVLTAIAIQMVLGGIERFVKGLM